MFHDRTMALVGRRFEPSRSAGARVSAVERTLGRRIPASLRELLASDAWPGLLEEFSNSDRPIALEGLQRSRWPNYDPLEDGLLPFMFENQGVCTWAVSLNAADDPEVLVEVNSGSPPTWQRAAPTFSGWLECQVIDKQLRGRAMFAAQAAPLTDDDLARLEQHFSAGPRTFAWPGRNNHRFSGPAGSILLWAGDDQCDWWIAPSSAAVAIDCLNMLPASIDGDGCIYDVDSESSEAREALAAWRRDRER